MNINTLHRISGICLSLFVGLHLFNHCYALLGAEAHIELMNRLRLVYRNIFIETLLLAAVIVQIFSGFKLFRAFRKNKRSFFEKLQLWTGLYLAFFLVIHLSAVLVGRFVLKLDTNFYFGVAGLNAFPVNVFFIPYYGLAVISFFGHVAAIHAGKMKKQVLGLGPATQAKILLGFGICLSLLILFALTNRFQGLDIPQAYHVLIGK